MSNDKENKKKSIKDIHVSDGKASNLADGIGDTLTGVAKTVREVINTPIRTAGRVIDGVIQGAKQGIEGGDNPVDTNPIIACTIFGNTGPPWTCSDPSNSDCFDDGDGIVLKVETFEGSNITGTQRAMTWTAVFRPGSCD